MFDILVRFFGPVGARLLTAAVILAGLIGLIVDHRKTIKRMWRDFLYLSFMLFGIFMIAKDVLSTPIQDILLVAMTIAVAMLWRVHSDIRELMEVVELFAPSLRAIAAAQQRPPTNQI
jgi:uncharacterized membrane protein YqgA involved in biofilm formation